MGAVPARGVLYYCSGMNRRIRVGIIGAGGNCRAHHIPKLQAIDGVEVAAVANRSRESGQRVADEFGIPRVADSWDQIVQDGEIDAVVIGTWPYLHGAVTIAALEAGKHVLCEARMATDSTTAREMYRASLAHPELVLQIVPSPMTLRLDRTIVRLIDEGYLGRILAIEWRTRSAEFGEGSPTFTWRNSREYSGNNIRNLGILYEALMRWVGPATRVTAMGRTFHPMGRADGANRVTDIPDHIDVVAEMACGAQLHIQTSGVTGVGAESGAYLFGTEGTLRIADDTLFGARRGDQALAAITIPESEAAGWRVEAEFVGAIRGEEQVRLTDPATGVRYMEFTDAVTMSMRSGRAVGLPLVGTV